MKNKILNLLKSNENKFISGEEIIKQLGVSISRAAIWKHINNLKEDGYEIESISRKGYRLISCPDILTYEEISPYLKTNYVGKSILYYESIDSTNIKAKEIANKDAINGTIIISEEQVSGKGRLGRSWVSPKYKGIWMSLILTPDINPINASKITLIGAAAVFKALAALKIDCKIKWPNDIIINNKKVCGILTEMSSELNRINYIIMGMGINVNLDKIDFPPDLQNIATSLKIETNTTIQRKILTAEILNNFEYLYEELLNTNTIYNTIDICKKNSYILGKEIYVINRNEMLEAKALDIDESGELLVEFSNGIIKPVISGEVSIRKRIKDKG